MDITTQLKAEALKELFCAGAANLKLHIKEVDELNVFPVPDGDTGTNMSMTWQGGVNAVRDAGYERISDLGNAFARGTLLGARGNSGVILSQFVKGLSQGMEDCGELTIDVFLQSFREGVAKAYDAVLNPTEGTMLTVMREGAEALADFLEKEKDPGFEAVFHCLNRSMKTSLEKTPELLPVLKEAGVIDSGGAGFLYLFQGMEKSLKGEEILAEEADPVHASSLSQVDLSAFHADSELEFGYCTEFILQLQNAKTDVSSFDKKVITDYLETAGDSIVAVQDKDIVKIHVHTFRPGDVLNFCQQFGEYLTLKIENMSVQHNEILRKEEKRKEKIRKKIAIIASLSGSGIQEYFREIGVDVIVDGGQTDNPSTEDFLEAFRQIEAEDIIILPCNSNIVMAAEQAGGIWKDADVHVVKAKTVAEAYAALSMMNLSFGVDEVIRDMESAIAETATGMITTSIRDMEYNGLQVKKGHFIGLDGDAILSDSPDRIETVEKLLAATEGIEDKAVVVGFYGREVPEEELELLSRRIKEKFSWLEFGFIRGGQDVYDYIFAIE